MKASLLLILGCLYFGVQTQAQEKSCAGLFASDLVETDLLALQRAESGHLSREQLTAKNIQTLEDLNSWTPRESASRVSSVDKVFADKVVESISLHPVVASYQVHKYKNGSQIGFCFGRATYVHLALLRAGVAKDSIKKIWAVGPMKTGAINWQFHVATMVKSKEGGWLVLDDFTGSAMTPPMWFQMMTKFSKDGSLRVYVTDPKKFSVSLGAYDRVQLGLDLPKEQDWYSHYFRDLMDWFSTNLISKVGLYDVRDIPY